MGKLRTQSGIRKMHIGAPPPHPPADGGERVHLFHKMASMQVRMHAHTQTRRYYRQCASEIIFILSLFTCVPRQRGSENAESVLVQFIGGIFPSTRRTARNY